jgi:hypothetical protein
MTPDGKSDYQLLVVPKIQWTNTRNGGEDGAVIVIHGDGLPSMDLESEVEISIGDLKCAYIESSVEKGWIRCRLQNGSNQDYVKTKAGQFVAGAGAKLKGWNKWVDFKNFRSTYLQGGLGKEDVTEAIYSLEQQWGHQTQAKVISGYFVPTATAKHRFFLSAYGDFEMYFNKDANDVSEAGEDNLELILKSDHTTGGKPLRHPTFTLEKHTSKYFELVAG